MVFNDAVVDQRDQIAADVGMGVAGARHTVSRPARMADADGAVERLCRKYFLEAGYLALNPSPLDGAFAADDGHPSRVISPIFEPLQPLEEDRRDMSLGYCTHDSAHKFSRPFRNLDWFSV